MIETPVDCLRRDRLNVKLFNIRQYNLKSFIERSFSFTTPSVFNSLTGSLSNFPILPEFKTQLKTFLFRQVFSQT